MNDLTDMSQITSLVVANQWHKIEEYFNNLPQVSHFGVVVNLNDPERPKCEVQDIKAFHLGGIGQHYINGGIVAAMLDLSIGLTALRYLEGGYLATSKLNVDYFKPIQKAAFYTVSKINQRVGNNIVAEATVFDVDNEPCVCASGVIKVGINKQKN